jgi:hypothetical protein
MDWSVKVEHAIGERNVTSMTNNVLLVRKVAVTEKVSIHTPYMILVQFGFLIAEEKMLRSI